MSDLVVASFKGEDIADQVLNKLREMQKEYLIDLEDACVVVRTKDGKVRPSSKRSILSARRPLAREEMSSAAVTA